MKARWPKLTQQRRSNAGYQLLAQESRQGGRQGQSWMGTHDMKPAVLTHWPDDRKAVGGYRSPPYRHGPQRYGVRPVQLPTNGVKGPERNRRWAIFLRIVDVVFGRDQRARSGLTGFHFSVRNNAIKKIVRHVKLDQNRKSLKLTGKESIDILGLTGVELTPRMNLTLIITRENGSREKIEVLCRIDTLNEVEYFKSGGILHYVLRQLIAS